MAAEWKCAENQYTSMHGAQSVSLVFRSLDREQCVLLCMSSVRDMSVRLLLARLAVDCRQAGEQGAHGGERVNNANIQ